MGEDKIKKYFHIHWFSKNIWPPTNPWNGEYPMRECRCGLRARNGAAGRWFVNQYDEWEYDDADYETI